MIHFKNAMELISLNPLQLKSEELCIKDALGKFLSVDIFAPINLPPFDNSAVDGFAFCFADVKKNNSLKVDTTIFARPQRQRKLIANTCVSIMTGAPVPEGADTVVMKEHTRIEGDRVIFVNEFFCGDHLRKSGGDIEQGSLIAKKGSRIDAALIGLLLGLGVDQIKVFCSPKIKITSTGDELVEAPAPLKFGQVYFLVGPMLKAQCETLGFKDVTIIKVADDQKLIKKIVEQSLDADLLLITGGMSQGSHDYVRPALDEVGVRQVFWQGAWRPGKPLYFGSKEHTRIFGLPGNPVAVFVGFRIFVQHLLGVTLGADLSDLRWGVLAGSEVEKNPGWTMFLRAQVDNDHKLRLLKNQQSHQIFTLAKSNALCLIDAPTTIVKAGNPVQYYRL